MLRREGHDVVALRSADSFESWSSYSPNLVLVDQCIYHIVWDALSQRIRKKSGTPMVVLTSCDEGESVQVGRDRRADAYVLKPFSPRQLVAQVATMLERSGAIPGVTCPSSGAADSVSHSLNPSIRQDRG